MQEEQSRGVLRGQYDRGLHFGRIDLGQVVWPYFCRVKVIWPVPLPVSVREFPSCATVTLTPSA